MGTDFDYFHTHRHQVYSKILLDIPKMIQTRNESFDSLSVLHKFFKCALLDPHSEFTDEEQNLVTESLG